MSQNEEQPSKTPDSEAAPAPAADAVDEIRIVEGMKPVSAPATEKPLRYGTRKARPGAAAPVVAKLGSVNNGLDEEEIEIDDLPVRATAPEHLVDDSPAPREHRDEDRESRPRRQDRPRRERRSREDRERSPEKRHRESEDGSTPETEMQAGPKSEASPETVDASEQEDRPERFAMVEPDKRRATASAGSQEFRPSRDGRTAPKRERAQREPLPKPEKKGFFAKILSFFTGGEEEQPAKKSSGKGKRSDNRGSRGRGRGGPRNRQNRESDEGGNRPPRKRRSRNRKPRPEGETREGAAEGKANREGTPRRRRRRSRRPREGGERREGGDRASRSSGPVSAE